MKLKFHRSSFPRSILVTSSRGCPQQVGRVGDDFREDVTRMLRGNGAAKFKQLNDESATTDRPEVLKDAVDAGVLVEEVDGPLGRLEPVHRQRVGKGAHEQRPDSVDGRHLVRQQTRPCLVAKHQKHHPYTRDAALVQHTPGLPPSAGWKLSTGQGIDAMLCSA